MRAKDIQIDGEYALTGFDGLSKVRIVEKGVRSSSWSERKDGVRVKVVAGHARHNNVVPTRQIEPWDASHDKRLEREGAEVVRRARVSRVSRRLGIPLEASYGGRVVTYDQYIYELADRLGVDTA